MVNIKVFTFIQVHLFEKHFKCFTFVIKLQTNSGQQF